MPSMPTELLTERLQLRQFRDDDLDPYAAVQADPVVARYVGDGSPTDREASWRLMALFLGHWTLRGHGQYAVVERAQRYVRRAGRGSPSNWARSTTARPICRATRSTSTPSRRMP